MTFSIPRRLRVYFRNHRALLAGLSRCAWEATIEADLVQDMLSWPHSGFHVWVGPLVSCLDSSAIEHMGQYSARGPVSLERLGLAPGGGDPPGQMRYESPEDVAGDGREWGRAREDLGKVIITSGRVRLSGMCVAHPRARMVDEQGRGIPFF